MKKISKIILISTAFLVINLSFAHENTSYLVSSVEKKLKSNKITKIRIINTHEMEDNNLLKNEEESEKNKIYEKYFELVSPEINFLGDVNEKDNLFISLKMLKKVDASLTVVKVKSAKSKVFLNSDKKKLDIIALKAPRQNIVFGENIDPITNINIDLDIWIDDEIEKLYSFLIEKLTKANEDYFIEYINTIKKENITKEKLDKIIFDRTLLKNNFNELYNLRNNYEVLANLYDEVKLKYDSLYGEKILDEEPIVIDGALPYFNINLGHLKDGAYEIIVTNDENGEILDDKINFYISNSEKMNNDFYLKMQNQIIEMLGIY